MIQSVPSRPRDGPPSVCAAGRRVTGEGEAAGADPPRGVQGLDGQVGKVADDGGYQDPASFLIVEVWKDAESARQFREEIPEDLKRLSQELDRKNPDTIFEHHFSMYEQVTATAQPASQ